MKTKPKKKPRLITMRFRKSDSYHNLLAATQAWVRANGGETVVIGGAGTQDWGGYKFDVVVHCLGRKPSPAPSKETHG